MLLALSFEPCSDVSICADQASPPVQHFLEGAAISYTATLINPDGSDVTITTAVVTANGVQQQAADCGSGSNPVVVPAAVNGVSGTVNCTFNMAITADEVAAGTLQQLTIEVLDGSTSVVTAAALDRSSIKLYRPGLTVAFDGNNCAAAPTMPGKQLYVASGQSKLRPRG
jgi:hypothetical protein